MNKPDFIPFEPSYTVDEFCKAERISRVKLYERWKRGEGPRHYFNGRCRRITHAARMEWQREMECRAKTQEITNAAGKGVVRELTLADLGRECAHG